MEIVSTGVDYIEYAHYLQIVQSCRIHNTFIPLLFSFIFISVSILIVIFELFIRNCERGSTYRDAVHARCWCTASLSRNQSKECVLGDWNSEGTLFFIFLFYVIYLFPLFFLQNKLTGGVVILNPQWLANVMATIITFSHKWVRNGILMHSDLAQLWKEKYPFQCLPCSFSIARFFLAPYTLLFPLSFVK